METFLILATRYGAESSIIELFLEKGACINDQRSDGITALHAACEFGAEAGVVKVLLEHGADLNILDRDRKTPLMRARNSVAKKILIEKLALMKDECENICNENLKFIASEEYLQELLAKCSLEIQRMKDYNIWGTISLYDIFQMRKRIKKLVFFTKNIDFFSMFRLGWNREFFIHYASDLDSIFDKAVDRKMKFEVEENELYSIFKDCLPELAITKIAYFANENLFHD